jgi:hypothetical protein
VLEHIDPERLSKAIRYLKEHPKIRPMMHITPRSGAIAHAARLCRLLR